MTRTFIVLCVCGLLSSCSSTGGGRFARSGIMEPTIRVLLAEAKKSYRVEASQGLSVTSPDGHNILRAEGPSGVIVTVRETSLQIVMAPGGAVAALEGAVVLVPNANSVLTFDNIRYAGDMRVVPAGDGTMLLINVVPVERYLEGVLPHEIGDPGPDGYDAVKTQAIAARTYALGKIELHKETPFDVYASVLDQVYRGLEGTTKVASAAVRETRGRVISYRGQTVKAYYSACCGGHTSDIRLVWPDREPADYLHGIPDRGADGASAFCRDYRRFRWRYNFTGRELGEILRVTIPRELGVSEDDVGALKDLRVDERSHSGRVMTLTIETTKSTFAVVGDRIRWILQTDTKRGVILPSVMFRLDKIMERDRITFVSVSGGGNGHGVGMCQSGSIAMAKRGYTYETILAHYYRGCSVQKVY